MTFQRGAIILLLGLTLLVFTSCGMFAWVISGSQQIKDIAGCCGIVGLGLSILGAARVFGRT